MLPNPVVFNGGNVVARPRLQWTSSFASVGSHDSRSVRTPRRAGSVAPSPAFPSTRSIPSINPTLLASHTRSRFVPQMDRSNAPSNRFVAQEPLSADRDRGGAIGRSESISRGGPAMSTAVVNVLPRGTNPMLAAYRGADANHILQSRRRLPPTPSAAPYARGRITSIESASSTHSSNSGDIAVSVDEDSSTPP